VVLLLIIKLVRGGGRWGGRMGKQLGRRMAKPLGQALVAGVRRQARTSFGSQASFLED
jgi:hypothetical protein